MSFASLPESALWGINEGRFLTNPCGLFLFSEIDLMKKNLFLVGCALALLTTAGCSTVINRSTQEVTIETPGTGGAICVLETEGYRYRVWAPKTIRIQKSEDPLEVTCRAPGNREKKVVIDPKIPGSFALNALHGFAPGALYDYETGAMFGLPEKIVVDFTDMLPVAMPLPDYQDVISQNPELVNVEEFRPGIPALQSDRGRGPVPLSPRQTTGDLFARTGAANTGAGAQTAASSAVSSAPASADDLTRTMNPQVFESSSEKFDPMEFLK